jgi:hypothetical protein
MAATYCNPAIVTFTHSLLLYSHPVQATRSAHKQAPGLQSSLHKGCRLPCPIFGSHPHATNHNKLQRTGPHFHSVEATATHWGRHLNTQIPRHPTVPAHPRRHNTTSPSTTADQTSSHIKPRHGFFPPICLLSTSSATSCSITGTLSHACMLHTAHRCTARRPAYCQHTQLPQRRPLTAAR